MRVHLVGVSGTGMGQLAILLVEAGHDVSGSDASFDPPMGPALEEAGVKCLRGWDAAHIGKDLELVVIGNAIRRENPEAVRATELDLPRSSMSKTLRDLFLVGRRPLVVCGTHGKTTTSAMCAWILACADLEPGYFIGGLPKNFPTGAAVGSTKKKLVSPRAPFVVEGDEYDAVYWHKEPKFFDYVGVGADDVAIVTSIEHDHIDIYASPEIYEKQFVELGERLGKGIMVADVRIAPLLRREVATVGLDVDPTPAEWMGALAPFDASSGAQPFDLFAGGSSCGRFALKVPGAHNVRNAIMAIVACAQGFGVSLEVSRRALASFEGVRRRQDLLGNPGGVAVYDDFAHHPTAVDETLRALRARHPAGKLFAVFEPRSATACRNIHQAAYPGSFGSADRVILAPLGRTNVPESERLDLDRLAKDIGDRALAAPSIDAIVETITREAKSGDTVALLSNGAFGGVHGRLLEALGS